MSKDYGLAYEDIIQLTLFPDGSPLSKRLYTASLFQLLLEKDAETHEKAVRFASLVNQGALRSLDQRFSSWLQGARPLNLNNFTIPEAYEEWCKETAYPLKRLIKGVNLLAGFKGQLLLTVKGLEVLDPKLVKSDNKYTVLVWIEDRVGMQQDVPVEAKIGEELPLAVTVEESFLRMQVWRIFHESIGKAGGKLVPRRELAAEVLVAVHGLTPEEQIDGVLPVFARASGHADSSVPIFDIRAPDVEPAGFIQAVHLDMLLCLTTEKPSDSDINLAQCLSGSGDLGGKKIAARAQQTAPRIKASSSQEDDDKELIRARWDWAIRTVLKGIKIASLRQGRKEQADLLAKSRVLQESEAVQERFRYLVDQMWQLWSRTQQLEKARKDANPSAVPVGLTQSATMNKLRLARGLDLEDQPLYYILERYDTALYAAVQNIGIVGEFIPDMRFFHPLFMFACMCGIRPKLLKAELVLKVLNQWTRANDAILTFMHETMNELKAAAFANKLSLHEKKLFQMLLQHMQPKMSKTLQRHHEMLDPLDAAGRRVLLEIVAHYMPKYNITAALAREVQQISQRRNRQILSKCDVHAVDHALKNLSVKGSDELQQIGLRLAEVWEQAAHDFEADLGWEESSKDLLQLHDTIIEHYKQMREASQLMISGAPSWPYSLYGQESMTKLEAAIMQVNKVMEKYELAQPLDKKPHNGGKAKFYLDGVGKDGFGTSSSRTRSMEKCWYKVIVYTSNLKGAGTDSEVYVNIVGSANSSGRLVLNEENACESTRELDLFEKGEKNEFRVYATSYLDALQEVEIGIDGHGKGHSWHLDRLEVIDETYKKTWYFECNEWLSRNRSDMKLSRKLQAHTEPPSERQVTYRVEVQTSHLKGAGTDAYVRLTMKGSLVSSFSQLLRKKLKNCFEKGELDGFDITCQNLGNILSIEVTLETKFAHVPADDWHLQDIRISNKKTDVQWVFLCNNWFDKDTTTRELFPLDETDLVLYRVSVTTSNINGAGTDAGITIILEGDANNSGSKLLHTEGKDTFEKGATDEFSLRCQDLGRVKWMQLGHNGRVGNKLSFGGSDWHVAKVELRDLRRSQVYTFPCDFWLGKSLSSKVKSSRIVQASAPKEVQMRRMVSYVVTVYTSNIQHAGSNVKKVHVELKGQDGLSGKQQLKIPKNGFQRGSADSSMLECTDVGQIEYIVLGTTSSSFSDSWHVERVEVAVGDYAPVVFPCNDWFSDKDGYKLERTLYPSKAIPGGRAVSSGYAAPAPTFTLLDWPALLWPKVEQQIQTITQQVPTMIKRHLDSITTWTAVSERTPFALEIRPVVEDTLGLIDACLNQVILVIAHSDLKARVATSVLTNAVQSNVLTVSQFISAECMESLMKVQPKGGPDPFTVFDDEGPAAGMLRQIMIRVNSMVKYQKAVFDTVQRFIDQTTKGNIMPVDTLKVKRQGELTSKRIIQLSFQVMSTLHKAFRFGFLVILSDCVQSVPENELVSVLPDYLLQKVQQIRSNVPPDRLDNNADTNWSALLEAAKRLVLGLSVWELGQHIKLSDEQHVLLEACLKALEIQLTLDLDDRWVPKESLLATKPKSHVRLLLEAGALPTRELQRLMNEEALEYERILAAKGAEPDIPYQGSEVVVEMDDVMQLQQNQNNLDMLDFIRLLRCRPDGKQAALEKLQDLYSRNRMQVLFGLPLSAEPQLFSGSCIRSCPKAANQAEKFPIPGRIFIFPSYLCFTSLLESGGPSAALATSDVTFILNRVEEDVKRVEKRSTENLEITLADETYLQIKFRDEATRDEFMMKWEGKGGGRGR